MNIFIILLAAARCVATGYWDGINEIINAQPSHVQSIILSIYATNVIIINDLKYYR